jgi:hypothetical protein
VTDVSRTKRGKLDLGKELGLWREFWFVDIPARELPLLLRRSARAAQVKLEKAGKIPRMSTAEFYRLAKPAMKDIVGRRS